MTKDIIWVRIGSIINYYGGLAVAKVDNKYYWTIEDWTGLPGKLKDAKWEGEIEEISEELYNLLLKKGKSNT